MDAVGSDPGVIYVSKEQDAEYGGYYYVYVTGGLYSHYGWNGLSGLTGYDEDVEALAVRCYRSKDLSTWSVCGSERGYSLIGRKSDWEEWTLRVPWAPEVLYNASEQKYYMFYNMPSKLYASGELKEQEGIRIAITRSIHAIIEIMWELPHRIRPWDRLRPYPDKKR